MLLLLMLLLLLLLCCCCCCCSCAASSGAVRWIFIYCLSTSFGSERNVGGRGCVEWWKWLFFFFFFPRRLCKRRMSDGGIAASKWAGSQKTRRKSPVDSIDCECVSVCAGLATDSRQQSCSVASLSERLLQQL